MSTAEDLSTARAQQSGPASPNPTYSQKSTVFEKLTLLCEELTSDIKSNSSMHQLGPLALQQSLEKLRERAFLDRSPEAQHALLLHRKSR